MNSVFFVTEKQCPMCKIIKPLTLEYFGKYLDYFQEYCLDCFEYEMVHYIRHFDKPTSGFITNRLIEKKCSKCGCMKPNSSEFFNLDLNSIDGLYKQCKKCCAIDLDIKINEQKIRRVEYSKKYSKTYYAEHKESIKQYTKDHKEELKYWRKNNREVFYEANLRRRTRSKNLPHLFTKDDKKFALEYWDYRCAVCGKELDLTKGNKSWAMDHWIPLSDPREDNPGTVPTNMIPICHGLDGCNNKKHNSDPVGWLNSTFSKEEASKILSDINTYFRQVHKA